MLAIYRLLQGILPPLGVPSARDVRGTGTVPMAGGQGHAEGGEAGSGAKLIEANGVKVAATPAWGQCPHISTLLPPSGCPQQCLCRAGRPLQPPRLCWQVCPGSTKASPLTTESHGAWGLGMAQQWVVGSSADGRAGAGWGGVAGSVTWGAGALLQPQGAGQLGGHNARTKPWPEQDTMPTLVGHHRGHI